MGCIFIVPTPTDDDYVPEENETVINLCDTCGKKIKYDWFMNTYRNIPENTPITIVFNVRRTHNDAEIDIFFKIAYVLSLHVGDVTAFINCFPTLPVLLIAMICDKIIFHEKYTSYIKDHISKIKNKRIIREEPEPIDLEKISQQHAHNHQHNKFISRLTRLLKNKYDKQDVVDILSNFAFDPKKTPSCVFAENCMKKKCNIEFEI